MNSELVWVLNLILEHRQLIAAAAAAVLVVFFVVWLLARRARLWYWKVKDYSGILEKQEASLSDISSRLSDIEAGLKLQNAAKTAEETPTDDSCEEGEGGAEESCFEGEVFSALSEERPRKQPKPEENFETAAESIGNSAPAKEQAPPDALKTPGLEDIPRAPQPSWKQVNVPVWTTENLRELTDSPSGFQFPKNEEDEFAGFREALLKRNKASDPQVCDDFLNSAEDSQDGGSSGKTRIKFVSPDQSVSRSGRTYTLEQIEKQIRD
ncbi:MAG: hypothetical protein K6F52_00555 [Clostridia bacterium]|nr:hypothetical protein [Clostridia bacterium]